MNSENNSDVILLKVLEAHAQDVGEVVVRADKTSLGKINVITEDIVEIKGKRRTIAKYLPLHPSDEGKGIIRIDGMGRHNSGSTIGDTIQVRKIKAAAAEKIVVAPLEAIPPIDERYLTNTLEHVPLVKGDQVVVPYFGGRLTFQVIGVTPTVDAVLVTEKTIFHVAALSNEKTKSYHDNIQQIIEDVMRLNALTKDELDSLILLIKKTHHKSTS